MTEREPNKVLEAQLPLAPNQRSYRIEKIGDPNGKGLAHAKELSVPVGNLLISEMERLVAELERLAEENQQLKQFADKFHYVDKRLAVLEVDKSPARANDLLAASCLVADSVGLGGAPNFVSLSSEYTWYLFVIVSAMLMLAGIVSIFHRTLGR